MAKGRKIEGLGTVIRTGSSCVGCMAWETPYVIIKLNGESFKWQSEQKVHELGEGDRVSFAAFAQGST